MKNSTSNTTTISLTQMFNEITPTPMVENDFTDAEKKQKIEVHFKSIMEILGLDLSDDSLRDTPKRVAKMFVEETMVDLFAPSVGNVHGLVKTGEPKLNVERIKEIRKAVSVPLVLHGASGNSDEDIRAAIKAGISVVHINTELRIAYKKGIEKGMSTDELAPYKFMAEGVEEMKKIVTAKLKLFNGL